MVERDPDSTRADETVGGPAQVPWEMSAEFDVELGWRPAGSLTRPARVEFAVPSRIGMECR
jgi:hypothetical protein